MNKDWRLQCQQYQEKISERPTTITNNDIDRIIEILIVIGSSQFVNQTWWALIYSTHSTGANPNVVKTWQTAKKAYAYQAILGQREQLNLHGIQEDEECLLYIVLVSYGKNFVHGEFCWCR